MLKLHHLRIGRSIFTVWLLEELDLEYEMETYHRDPNTMRAPDSLKKAHPLGKSPVIEDGSLVLSESGAINNYLMEKYDSENRMHPSSESLEEWAQYQQWLAYPEGSVFAPLLMQLLLTKSGVDHPAMTPFSLAEVKLHFDHISAQLGEQQFIMGDEFSGADFGIAYMVSMAKNLGLLEPYPSLNAYLERMQARPAFIRAVERAVE